MTIPPNPLRDALRAGRAAASLWLELGSPAVADLAAEARPDCAIFDLQHGLWDRQSLEASVAVVRDRTVPVARVAANRLDAINPALDAGCRGIIVPLVETAEEARSAVAACRYPPAGRRSAGGIRPSIDFGDDRAASNASVVAGVMIETEAGLANAGAIASVPGLDLVYVGPGDLALSLGSPPGGDDRHEAAVRSVLAAARAAGIACGIFTPDAGTAARRRAQGFTLVNLGTDSGLLLGGARAAVRQFAAP